ncbi:diacylglycerol kinase family protein [Calothrix sp. UHCC 0171]|uniref:diacylglycerol/lipid kinase family protein n=1 Tax=Calothrix sp. UHCC 0171 TaxID=3110245 RepID=UPI002B1F2563|nr:diacylglycerol kinase family protein [Calothrix sp. UHCC 0171]MEA5571097.1 diacylglycerol kinase family protein [Calothrix sp. UHCC 0171]
MGTLLPPQPLVLILFNPFAGQAYHLKQTLESAADIWRKNGWDVELRPTQAPGDATVQARDAASKGFDVVVAAGGDGTVNEVMNGLVGTSTALAVLPIGTVNIWARELGLSMDLRRVAAAFLQAQIEQIDVGKAGTRYFLLMAGIGFDAAVTATINPREKKMLGAIAYVKQALQLSLCFQGIKSHIRIDGKRIKGKILMVVIGNSQLYGGVVKLTAHAVVNDGLLDVCIIKGRSMLVAPLRLLSVFRRRYNLDPKVEYYRAQKVQIKGKKTFPVQIDGDYLGITPMNFEVVVGGLRVLVPPSVDKSLWTDSYIGEGSLK